MKYEPNIRSSRQHLAVRLTQMLLEAGFIEEFHEGQGADPTKEAVFYRPVDGVPRTRVKVYTTIIEVNGERETREVGKDAIRIVVMYKAESDGQERCLGKETRTHRTGDVDDICQRTLERMRESYKKGLKPDRCPDCGAPMFTSKKGKAVCAELCWKRGRPERRDDSYESDYEGDVYAGTLRPYRRRFYR